MKIIKLFAMSALISTMASVALAQSPPPLEGTGGFGENYSDVNQAGPGNGATANQFATLGARNDSFIDQVGAGGSRSATVLQSGGATVKNYSFVEQVGGSLNTVNVTQGFVADTAKTNRSEIYQEASGSGNTISVNQTGIGLFNTSFVRKQTGTGGNAITIQQNGILNANTSDIVLQGGDTNTITVNQGLSGGSSSLNDSLITEQDGPGGNNHITVVQNGTGTINFSTVRQFGTGAGDNAILVTQNGGPGTFNTSDIDQEGELNDAQVSQGAPISVGIVNDSTVSQLGTSTAIITQN